MAEDEDRFLGVKIPLCCDATIPITVKLLKKHKDIKEIQEIHAAKQEEFKTRMRKANERQKELEKKEQLLVEALKEYEGFIQESKRKKLQADSKIMEEKKVISEMDEELKRQNMERTKLLNKRKMLEEYLEKYLPSQKFLDKVAEESVQFEDASDIISFYETLLTVNEELTREEECHLLAIDEERDKLNKLKTEKENHLLILSNQLYELKQEQERTQNKLLSMETHYNDIRSSNNKRSMTMGQITMAISSMYMTICNFEKSEPTEHRPLKQMEKVHDFIQAWSEVVVEIKRRLECDSAE